MVSVLFPSHLCSVSLCPLSLFSVSLWEITNCNGGSVWTSPTLSFFSCILCGPGTFKEEEEEEEEEEEQRVLDNLRLLPEPLEKNQKNRGNICDDANSKNEEF